MPFAVRYPRGSGTGEPLDDQPRVLPVGKGELLRNGSDLALIAIGNMVPCALEAADLLAARGVNCAVVDARYVKPLDEELLLDVIRRCRRAITVEENVMSGGLVACPRASGIQEGPECPGRVDGNTRRVRRARRTQRAEG